MLGDFYRVLTRWPGDKGRIYGLFLIMTVSAALEAVGIGLVLPFVAVVQDPDVLRKSFAYPLYQALGATSTAGIVIVSGIPLVVFFLLKNVYILFAQWVQMRFIYARLTRLSRELLASYLARPYAYHLEHNSQELTRNAVVSASDAFTAAMPQFFILVVEGVTIFIVTAFLLFLEPVAVPVSAVVVGACGYAMGRYYREKGTILGERQRDEQVGMMRWAQHALGGVKEVTVAGASRFFLDGFTESSRRQSDAIRAHRTIIMFPRLTLEVLGVLGLVLVASIVVVRGGDAKHLMPLLGALAFAVVRLMPSLTKIVGALGELRFYVPTIAAMKRDLHDGKDEAELPPAPRLPFEKELRLASITFQYPEGDAPALADVDLTVTRGESVALVGRSGSGKTTLVDVLLGLHPPQRGDVLVDGEKVDGEAWRRLRSIVGYIPQTVFLCDDSLRANIAFGVPTAEIDDERVWHCLEVARLRGFAEQLPEQLDTAVGERGVRLSGGQRQRLGIARALYRDPQILVLDEATSALDGITESEVVEAIDAVRKDRTSIVIAHRLSTVKKCDRLVLLSNGRVEHVGTWDELMATSEPFRELARHGFAEDAA